MKFVCSVLFVFFVLGGLMASSAMSQTSAVPLGPLERPEPWSDKQLIEPADLSAMINGSQPAGQVIFNIGSAQDIKGAKHIGPVSDTENMKKLVEEINSLPKTTEIIIYCGCCPFEKCPNIRPAFTELTKLGFANLRVLDLPNNLKTNWISKGYPLGNN